MVIYHHEKHLYYQLSKIDEKEYLYSLSEQFSSAQVLVTGYQIIGQDFVFPENVTPFFRIENFLEFLDQIAL